MRTSRIALALLLLAAGARAQNGIATAIAAAEHEGVRVGVAVRDLDASDTWFEHDADEPLIPASNQKLLTIAAAFAALGQKHEFETGFTVQDGVLVVTAGGDPNWITGSDYAPSAMFARVTAALRAAGITKIRRIALDLGKFTGPARPDSWPLDQRERAYCAPTAGLMLDLGCFEARIAPASGGSASVEVIAPPAGFRVTGAIKLTDDKKAGSVHGARQNDDAVQVHGALWRKATPKTVRGSVEDPVGTFERALERALAADGIAIDAAASPAAMPKLALRTPLAATLRPILAESSNVHAEQVLRVVGAEVSGDGSLEGGCAAVRRVLASTVGELPRGVVIADGSGLSRDDRATAGYVVRVLEALLRSEHASALLDHLPQGGVDGTLSSRFERAPLRGRVRAKTGTINGVSALSGVIRDQREKLQAFSILMNVEPGRKVTGRAMRDWQDAIVAAIHAQR